MARKQAWKEVMVQLTEGERLDRGKLAGTCTKQVLALKEERSAITKQITGLEAKVRDLSIAVKDGVEKQNRLCDVEEIGRLRRFYDPETGERLAEEPITDIQETLALGHGEAN